MADEHQPLLSVPYLDEEMELNSFSTNSDKDTKIKKNVINNFEDSVDRVVANENRGKLSANKHKPLPQGKDYHLFMSYSTEDRDYANSIREHLEERFHLNCLYFERDFHSGKSIEENIMDGLQKSVKALILLSPFYLQSFWCVTEAREACRLSFTDMENNNIIPVLLRPLQSDLPAALNSYIYIDAQREIDVAGKIHEAFNQPGILDPLQISKSGLPSNGTLLFRKIGTKANYVDHGLAYRFSPLEPYEEENISQSGLDLLECRNHYNALMKDLNNHELFQYYPVVSSMKWQCVLLCTLTSIFVCIWIGSLLLSRTNDSPLKNEMYWYINLIVGPLLLICICPCGFIFINGCRKGNSRNIQEVVLQFNIRFYRSSKCIVYLDQSSLSDPTDFLLTVLNQFKEDTHTGTLQGNSITNKEIVKNLIHLKLEELQSTQALIKWTRVRESAKNRHRTSNNRACVCEMLEDHVKKNIRAHGGSSVMRTIHANSSLISLCQT